MNNANKAWVAALVAGLGSLLAQIKDRTSLDTMTPLEWVIVVVTATVAGLTVYMVSNQKPLLRQ